MRHPPLVLAVRVLVTGLLLAFVAREVGPTRVAGHLADLRPGWVAIAVALAVAQLVASAWRWRYTAGKLGLDLPLVTAVREYYLATFLNQVLPGGVVGDVSRAWRHGGRAGTHGVMLERASGQLVMAGVALGAAGVLFLPPRLSTLAWSSGSVTVGVVLWTWAMVGRRPGSHSPSRKERTGPECGPGGTAGCRRRPETAWPPDDVVDHPGILARFTRDAGRGLLSPRVLPVQVATSLAVVAGYVALFVAAARAVGVSTPLTTLAPLVPLVLLAMLLPVSVGGWGVREGAAAGLWASVGLPPAEGVAASVTYGLLVLVTSLPGIWVLLRDGGGPGRTGRPRPEESDGMRDEGPRRARPPAAA